MDLSDDLQKIKGVGVKTKGYLEKLGLFTVGDILVNYPRDFEIRPKPKKILELEEGVFSMFVAKTKGSAKIFSSGKLKVIRLKVFDDSAEITLNFFNQSYMLNYFKNGEYYVFLGSPFSSKAGLVFNVEAHELYDKEKFGKEKVLPIYSLTKGLGQKKMRSITKLAVEGYLHLVDENIPDFVLQKNDLLDRKTAIEELHFPNEVSTRARDRILFEEVFKLRLSLFWMKEGRERLKSNAFSELSYLAVLENLPFDLTKDQTKVVSDICKDISQNFAMNRLVQGDVGSGKTIVSLIACYICIKNGFQASLMAPTDVLARQHHLSYSEIFDRLGIKTVLLTASVKAKEKKQTLAMIENGEAKMVIGTHAVIQNAVKYKNLGLVITDEQHRFGVNQRKTFSDKGENPHVLIMSATPIPRTLALIIFADMDISIVKEMPSGRKKIETFFVSSGHRQRLYAFIEKEIASGRQVFVICPLIEDSELLELASVQSYTKMLQKSLDPKLRIGSIHGKMKAEEKNAGMESFATGELDILVSTTVVEVGINVANATVMMIEDAHRYGLSQLHQLRGRVGRGEHSSFCFLISDSKSENAKKRLRLMEETSDGFSLSEIDLNMRGPGDFFGTMQHGNLDINLGSLYDSLEMLEKVNETVDFILENPQKISKKDMMRLKNFAKIKIDKISL